MSTKICFLDIDGVLNSIASEAFYESIKTGISTDLLDLMCVACLNLLVKEVPDIQFVITSTWRKRSNAKEVILKSLSDAYFDGILHIDWRTIDSDRGFRGDEVNEWISRHPEITQWICFDDDSDFYPENNLIQTDFIVGLTFYEARIASLILSSDNNERALVKDLKYSIDRHKRNLEFLSSFLDK